jgi:ubiquinone/menaquinone biosynthesis C-methylase UbiE
MMAMFAEETDWRGYDAIADRYDRVWAGRFEPIGRALWDLTRPASDAFVLDIGTGTGALPLTLRETTRHHGSVVGCDRSLPMLHRAEMRVPGLSVVAADAVTLPFRSDTFDAATASFVLSHVIDYRQTLDEAHRVLKVSGTLGVSNWAPPSDVYSAAWAEALARVVSTDMLDRAVAEITPHEGHFSQNGRLEDALHAGGFGEIRSRAVDIELSVTVDEYLADRAMSVRGRLARHLLGSDTWSRWNATTGDQFRERFSVSFVYHRQVLIAAGEKTATRSR